MVDTTHIKDIVERAMENAKAAGFDRSTQLEHALRALQQAAPEVSEKDARTALRRVVRSE
ncbi:MAG: hypothetical protein R3245_06175 [Kiloniellales bacterium]|nr:hypothetical protein [Kiloniellales bacterium]